MKLKGEINAEVDLGMADMLMMRGSYLRKLRELEFQDELERQQNADDESTGRDRIDSLQNGQTVLRYSSYLQHQSYYDDYKHVNCDYIDFGTINGNRLIIQQEKALPMKGGLCWDPGYILGQHLAEHEHFRKDDRVVELGAGTGLAGLMLAKATPCQIEITDLPHIVPLIQRNIHFNQTQQKHKQLHTNNFTQTDLDTLYDNDRQTAHICPGTVSARPLTWGNHQDYPDHPYDVIIGADIVASLYDPVALAETLWELSHANSTLYISSKGRLDEPHQIFEQRFAQLFQNIQQIIPSGRNKCPNVVIFKASGRVDQKTTTKDDNQFKDGA